MKNEEVLLNIQRLIEKAACGIDGFFTDSRTAAKDIISYLQKENLFRETAVIEMQHNRAA